ncbi:MAG TPA: 3D domain-containing protein, partial [Gaiellaceae bacterium]|nr:3D domain-containing protein [Gaiellaceae bacterium]
RLVRSALVRGCSSMLAARRLAVCLGVAALFTLSATGGAAVPANSVGGLRERANTLAAQERAATLDLYALEAQLAQARSRLTKLSAQREKAEAQLRSLRIQLDVAWQSAFVAEERLAGRIRQLYQSGTTVNPVAVLLGAQSLDEAISGLEGLRSVASGDRDIVLELRRARAELTAAKRRIAARAAELATAEDAAAATAARLDAARTERRAYIAQLTRERGFNARRIARVQRVARTAGRQSTAIPLVAPTAAVEAPAAPVVTATVTGERTLTVAATGYSIHGQTATGLPTGWGVVAVDPSVIPLGTRLTIPGYGQGVAADTGGAVRGATIDLWFPTTSDALAWGRRTVTITLH